LLSGLSADSNYLAKVPASGGPLMRTCVYWGSAPTRAVGESTTIGSKPPREAFCCHERDHSSISSLSRQQNRLFPAKTCRERHQTTPSSLSRQPLRRKTSPPSYT